MLDQSACANGPRLTVLFLIKHMDIGGGEYVMRSIIERLDKTRFKPILACLTIEGRLGKELRADGITVYANLLKHKADLSVLARLRSIIRREGAQLIYMTDYRDVMLWGPLAGRLCGVPTILATHSTDWWGRGPLRSPTLLGKKLLGWHARIVAIADFQRRHMIEREGVSATQIEVIPNGVNASLYRPRNGAPHAGAQEVAGPGVTIGTVAVLRKEKNVGMLFEAVRRLVHDGREINAVIVGDGDQRQTLMSLAQSMGLKSRVRFLGYRERPAEILPAFDIFTLTSLIEVMPISILEAMACGVPVIATAVGAVAEIVVDGETGYVVPSQDVDALTDRLRRLSDDADLRRRMGEHGRRRVEDRFTIGTMIARTSQLLVETAADRVQCPE
jgi:glycosyltransferase involved in cell wall biosynthesis